MKYLNKSKELIKGFMSEAELVNRLKQGDEQAFRELVESYREKVTFTCLGFLHNLNDAEDVAQDVFIEVFRTIGNFRGDSKISTWLHRIAVTRSLNYIRNNKKRKWVHSIENSEKEKNSFIGSLQTMRSDNPEYVLENNQRALLLNEAINSLPQNQKVAFTLNKYNDLSYHEISIIMELSVLLVESLIHRAKTGL